ncbi:hypothetical protein KP509_11G063200 [Ceratopteris richardii]|uniref:Retinol dehydrogenase 14 n=1 Tax=Ceratopteris richardii TaxID=49495 RepID=A0A8T2TYT3_CERRI|nr:hypothetical protein KP509_11G063200 [Ceratopteris richardii]
MTSNAFTTLSSWTTLVPNANASRPRRERFSGSVLMKAQKVPSIPNGERHVIITGGNCGIGKATAVELAKQAMHITLACRSKERGEKACLEISSVSGNPNVRTMTCDLASFDSIHRFVENYLQEGLPLHVLVNNAGIMACPQSYTKDGFEMQFGVNHLGHFLLTKLLLKTLAESATAGSNSRVVVLASLAERLGKIDFNDLNFKSYRVYNAWLAYGQSKLANCLFSKELSKRSKSGNIGVISNSMHPGIVDTELIRYAFPLVMRGNLPLKEIRPIIVKLLGLKTPEEGASTAVYLASSHLVEGISGAYFEDCQIREPSLQAQNSELASQLWRISEELTGTRD